MGKTSFRAKSPNTITRSKSPAINRTRSKSPDSKSLGSDGRRAYPLDEQLYESITAEAKSKFLKWPSIYASSWVVKEYKRRGGCYGNKKPTRWTPGLKRWVAEMWINTCELPKIVPCGRDKADVKKYPYCRPYYRVTRDTPTTALELSKQTIKKNCQKKRSDPFKQMPTVKPNKSK